MDKFHFVSLISGILFFLIFLLSPPPVFAVTVTITDYPSTITDDLFTITASISGATAGTNYLKIDLFKDQTTNYFGETFNGSDWYGGSTYSQYLPVTIQSGVTWSGNVQGRVGSPTTTQYDGSGTYKMRLRRYTSGGGYTASEANNSAVEISIALPTSTPTPTNTPAPTSTPTSVPTAINTPTPTPTRTPTPTPTAKTTSTPTPKPTSLPSLISTQQSAGESGKTLDEDNMPTAVLGESTKNSSSAPTLTRIPTPVAKILGVSQNNLSKIFIGLGVIFLASCGILAFREYKKNYEKSLHN